MRTRTTAVFIGLAGVALVVFLFGSLLPQALKARGLKDRVRMYETALAELERSSADLRAERTRSAEAEARLTEYTRIFWPDTAGLGRQLAASFVRAGWSNEEFVWRNAVPRTLCCECGFEVRATADLATVKGWLEAAGRFEHPVFVTNLSLSRADTRSFQALVVGRVYTRPAR